MNPRKVIALSEELNEVLSQRRAATRATSPPRDDGIDTNKRSA
jgi:hypothetical protein